MVYIEGAYRPLLDRGIHSMSDAAPPCPDAGPAVTPATPTAASQLAGIRELIRIAELQAQAYARAAPMEPAESTESTESTQEIPVSG